MTRQNARAFTLVEVMVAIAILLIAIFGTIGAMGVAGNLRFSTRQNEIATQMLRRYVEELRSMDRDQVNANAAPTNLAEANLAIADEESAPLGKNGVIRSIYVLSEREARLMLPTDTDYDGSITAGDTYDFDNDGSADEDSANSDRSLYPTVRGRIIPVLVRLQWGRPRAQVNGKADLVAVQDATPTGNQVLGIPTTMNVTREFYVETITFLYPTTTSN